MGEEKFLFINIFIFSHNVFSSLLKVVEKGEISNFTLFHNVFYPISILKSFDSHIWVVVCSFVEFWMVSKWFIRKWVHSCYCSLVQIESICRDTFIVAQMVKYFCSGIESIVRKGENTGNQYFLLFPQCFHKHSFSGLLEVGCKGLRKGYKYSLLILAIMGSKDNRIYKVMSIWVHWYKESQSWMTHRLSIWLRLGDTKIKKKKWVTDISILSHNVV